MTQDSDDDDRLCPVCKDHGLSENLQSQGLIITGMQALYDGDENTIRQVAESLTAYDGHTAIGMAAGLVHDLSMITGLPIETWLKNYRQALNEAQAEAS